MIPTDLVLPLQSDLIRAGDSKALELYLRQLVEALTDSYRITAQNLNGSLQQWSPEIFGSTVAGQGTYSFQTGWYLRAGIMVDLWYDVAWTAHTGVGSIIMRMPFKAAKTLNAPWAGANFSDINLGAGYTNVVMTVNSDTFDGVLLKTGSGVPISNVTLTATGRLLGHVRYVGQEFEN